MRRALLVLIAACLALPAAADGLSSDALSQDRLNRLLRHEATFGRIARIDSLVREGADVNGTTEYGQTALYYAILWGRVKAAMHLIELGADPNSADDQDRTPLLRAAEDCDTRVVRALLKAGADVNHADFQGHTALMGAVRSKCVRTVAAILMDAKGKVRLDTLDGSFQSAADYARYGGHPWIIRMLEVARGGNPRETLISSDSP